jgi:hypothetical protein
MTTPEHELQPLAESVTGCTLTFVPTGDAYQPLAALAVLAALNAKGFTGTCECYIRPGTRSGKYLMGIALEFESGPPGEAWWRSFVGVVAAASEDDEEVHLNRHGSDFTTVGELRKTMRHAGTAGYEAGAARWVLDPEGSDPDSPFSSLCRRIRDEGA